MRKRPITDIAVKLNTAKRSDVKSFPCNAVVLPARTICMKHVNSIDVSKAVTIKLELDAPGVGQKVSKNIDVCKNTACHICDKQLLPGDVVESDGLTTNYTHVPCSKGLGKKLEKCMCHNRDVSLCRAICVKLNGDDSNVKFICDDIKCPNCSKGFVINDYLVFEYGGKICHRWCAIKCAVPGCLFMIPVSAAKYPVCGRHTTTCVKCLSDCSSPSSHVAVMDGNAGEKHTPILFLCITCYVKTKSTEIQSVVKIPTISCRAPTCETDHIRRVEIKVENNEEQRAITCPKAACSNCALEVDHKPGISYLIDDGNLACKRCFVPCDFCNKTLLRKRPTPEYGGACAVANDPGWGVNNVCPHHATMPCGNCTSLISVDMDTGKYYPDVGEWQHHKCYANRK